MGAGTARLARANGGTVEVSRVDTMTAPVPENAVTDLDCAEPLRGWLVAAVESEASDLHVVAGHHPVLRIHGSLEQISGDAVSYTHLTMPTSEKV